MKSTIVYEDGTVRCPKCGANVAGAATKRTGKGKVMGLAGGGIGLALAPKRLKCSGCGENLKRGSGAPTGGAGRAGTAVMTGGISELVRAPRAGKPQTIREVNEAGRAKRDEIRAEQAAKKQAKVDAQVAKREVEVGGFRCGADNSRIRPRGRP